MNICKWKLTPAQVFQLSEEFCNDRFRNFKIELTSLRSRTYDGNVIVPVGKIRVQSQVREKKTQTRLIIVKDGSRPLFGRDLMEAFPLNIEGVRLDVNNVSKNGELGNLLKEYAHLFDGKLGCYSLGMVDLKVKPEDEPIIIKPRPLASALKEKVENELIKLEKSGVILH